MQRNKAAIMASGIDPQMKRLNRLHAIRSRREKQFVAALESIENYWREVNAAIEEKECASGVAASAAEKECASGVSTSAAS